MKVLGKQVQTYTVDFKTGETKQTRKISIYDPIDKEEGEGFGLLAETYSVNSDDYREVFDKAEKDDEVKLQVQKGTTKDGKSYEKVITFMIRKKDGTVIGW